MDDGKMGAVRREWIDGWMNGWSAWVVERLESGGMIGCLDGRTDGWTKQQ